MWLCCKVAVLPHRSSATNQQSTKVKVFPVLQFKNQKKEKTKNHLEQKKSFRKRYKDGKRLHPGNPY
jgi:hypothetical protein